MKTKRLAYLKCSCCGAQVAGRWRQWPNRDTGYGVCMPCVEWLRKDRHMDADEFIRCYGHEGKHYGYA